MVDPCSIGINDLDTVLHVAVEDPVVHDVSYLGELLSVVNSPCVIEIADNRANRVAVTDKDSDGICKVIFLLGVVRADPAQSRDKERCLENIH